MIEKIKISYFKGGANSIKPSGSMTLKTLIKLMTNDNSAKLTFEKLRKLKQEKSEEYTKVKSKLVYITTSGLFTQRNNNDLIRESYTWLCPIDIDGKDNPNVDMNYIFLQLCSFDSTIFCGKSPSGTGIKAIIKLKNAAYNIDDHYLIMKHIIYPKIEKALGCILDYSQGKLSQPFFLTYDEDAYVNFSAIDLETDYSIKKKEPIDINNLPDSNNVVKRDYLIDKYCDKISNVVDNKYNLCGSVAMTLGGWYRMGYFTHTEKYIKSQMYKSVEMNNNIKDKQQKYNFIDISFQNGYEKPIEIKNEYDVEILKKFEYIGATSDEIKKYKEALFKAPLEKVIDKTSNLFSFNHKVEKRKYLMYPIFKEKQLGIIFGNSGDGKSIFAIDMANQIAMGQSYWEGFKVETEPQKVLYIDFELGPASLQERYTPSKFSSNLIIDNVDNFHYNTVVGTSNNIEERLDKAINWIILQSKRHDCKVIFVDNLSNIADNTEKASDADKFISDLYARKISTGLSIMFLGHTPKVPSNAPLHYNQLKGSSSLSKTFETMIGFKRSLSEKDVSYLKQLKSRDVNHIYDDDNVAKFKFENNSISGFTLKTCGNGIEDELLIKIKDNRNTNGGAKIKYDDKVIFDILDDMINDNLKYRDIQEKYGISRGNISRWRNEYDDLTSDLRHKYDKYKSESIGFFNKDENYYGN